ncbi:MAG: Crp/Fnr family transcriptional regulator [Psychrilyobacter sp.]|nr:Crp/Fnr family transcriptional regulator [Psychrilyobacter sp.]
MEILEKIKKLSVFKGIEEEKLKEIFKNLNYKIRKVEKDEVVAFRGDILESLIIVTSGEVYTEMQKLNGDSIVVDRITMGVLAGAFIFGKDNRFPVDVIAEKTTELVYIPKEEILRLFQQETIFLQNYLGVISNKTQFLSKKIWFSFTNKSINNKLIAYLLNNTDRDNIVTLKNSIKEIAQMFGVARPSLSRVLKGFIDDKILMRIETNKFEIISKEKLLEKVD